MYQVAGRATAAPWAAMAALTAVTFGATAGLERAAEPPPPTKKLTFRDIQLTVHARKALADDPSLGPVNLGVRVQDNVALLWGPVPSDELKRRAAEVVKQVPGVFEVRDADVYVAPPPPEAPATPPPPPPAAPTRTESDSPDAAAGAPGAFTARPAADPPPGAVLGPPLPAADAGAARAAADPPPDDLAAALERVHADPRFRSVGYRLEGDTVVLRLGPADGEAVMAFARAVVRLPGLAHVTIRADGAADPPH